MAPATNILERELQEINEQVRLLDTEAQTKHASAEALVESLKERGINPLSDEEAFAQVDAAYTEADTAKENASRLRQRAERVVEMLGLSEPKTKREARRNGAVMNLAARIMATPEYEALVRANAFEGTGSRIEIPGIEVVSRDEAVAAIQSGIPLLRAATADAAELVPADQRLMPPVAIPVRQVRLLDLIRIASTDSDTVIWTRETTRTDVAAETAAGTAYSEATYAYEDVESTVRDIGHWTPAHRRQMADQGQLQALLEGRLANGVERRLESQVASGDGLGQNLEGIYTNSVVAANEIERDTTNESRLAALHRGITAVRLSAFVDDISAIGLHPTDYHEVVVETDDNGQFLLGPAAQSSSKSIWGYPVAVSSVFTLGTGLVGDYGLGAVLYLRSGVTVRASDSHANFFTERRVALLAEMRAAFAVEQGEAFCPVADL